MDIFFTPMAESWVTTWVLSPSIPIVFADTTAHSTASRQPLTGMRKSKS